MFSKIVGIIKSNVLISTIIISGIGGALGVGAYQVLKPIKATTDTSVSQEQVAKDKEDQSKKDEKQDKKIDETSSQIAQLQVQTSSVSNAVSSVSEKVVVIEKQVTASSSSSSNSSSSSVASSAPATVTPVVTPPTNSSSSSSSSSISKDDEVKKLLELKSYQNYGDSDREIYLRPGQRVLDERIEFKYMPGSKITSKAWFICVVPNAVGGCFQDTMKTPEEVIEFLKKIV